MKMRQHHNIILRWDETLYKEREQAHNYRVAQKQKHLEKHPGQKELINYASMRNELIYYGNNITGNKSLFVIKQKYRNYGGLHGYGNVSYLADFDLKSESNDAEASENQDFNALGNEEISKGLSFCDKEAGYSLELGIPHAIQPPSLSTTPTKHIDSWFPTWQDGVCRIIGQISSSSKLIITGAILSFSETDQTFTTLQGNYKFSENIDKKSLAKYMKMDRGLSFITDADNMYSTLQQDNWLENIVKLSLQSEYAFFKFSGASINKFLLKDRQKSVSGVLFEKKAPKIPSNLCKSVKCPDYESICKELENLLEIVQNNGDWRKHFQILLKKCGQNVDHDLFREKDPNETLTFEGFLEDGNMCNSTLNKIEAQLVLWSIVKDINDGFCIKGLEYVDDKKKFYEIKPSPITRDTDYGAKVIAEKCSYKLLGPLYALSIRLAYPNFLNSDYLWPFLSYFRMGLPKNWKNYISIIDILSKCSLLRYVSRNTNAENLNEFNLSEKTMMNNSPSFIPSTSILSSSNNKDSSNNKENYRRSIKRNSTITSKSLRENNTNNEENDVFKENDKAICKRLSDMTNVFCSLDQTENIYKNKKSILKNRTSVRNVGATSSLDAHSIIQKTHNVAVVENELPLNLKISRHCDIDSSICCQSKIENNKVNTEFKVSNQMFESKLNRSQLSKSNQLKFTEQKVQKTPETKVKKRFESNKKINNLKNVASEDFHVSRNINAQNLNIFNLSEKTMMDNSPSFIPPTSISSSSNNKGNYRRSIKRNSTINSNILRENNTNNEENDVFKENDKSICPKFSDMTNVFCSLDQTENIYKNKKSILKNSVRNVGATSSLDAHSIIQKTHNVAVVENELPLNLKISRHCVNNKVNTEFKVSNQMCSQRSRSNQLKFTEQKVQKSPETKVKKKFESNKKINNLKNVAIEDFQCPTQISRDLNSPLSVGRTSSNTVQIYQSPFQSICSRKRKSQQVLIETPSKKKRLNNVEETKVSQNKESFGNKNKKLKSVLNVEETKKRYNRKSVVNTKPECSSVSKVRFSLNSETRNQTERKKRTSMNKSRKVQAEPTDSDGIESDLYFQADNFLINIKTTRSGRKSIPPIDPRSDIERFQEDGKPYLISKGQKFEL